MFAPIVLPVALAAGAAASDFVYGMSNFVMPTGPWIPPTGSYSSGPYQQVVFLSFDGMHQFDLTRYIAENPTSNWASIVQNAVVYSNARGTSPSDSLPATASIFTGASPRNHGIFWEAMFDRSLYTGGTNCTGPIGAVCDYSEAADLNSTMLDGGNGFNLTFLPHQKTSWGACQPILPHNFLRTNTIFEVGRANGLWTAYADKHLAYEFVNGPSGVGLSEGYFPEISSFDKTLTDQQTWDDLHWSALRNWTNGQFVNGTTNPAGGPRLYAANFQTITYAQQTAGYLDAAGTPNKTLATAFKTLDERLGTFLKDLKTAGRLNSTLVMIGSKQGQGPIDPKTLKVVDPNAVMNATGVNVTYFTGEDGGIMYLEKSTDAATAKANLLKDSSLGISYVLIGDEVQAAGFGSPTLDPRVPDLIIGTNNHTLWNSPFEFEDHGGFLPQDLNVPLLAYNPGLLAQNITQVVSNRQIASSMLMALGLAPSQLQAYTLGECPVLPGLFN